MKRSSNNALAKGGSHGGLDGVRSSKNRFNTAICRNPKGMGRVKRVKFIIPENRSPLCRTDASKDTGGTQARRSDDPKTAEYAFFQKLKEEAGHRFHSNPLPKQENKLKKLESNVSDKDVTGMIVQSYKNLRSPVHVGKIKSLYPGLHPPSDASKNSGTPGLHEDIFSKKRLKLHQLAADTLSIEKDELFSQGCNLVTLLVGRLFPDSSKTHCLTDSQLRHSTSQVLAFPLCRTTGNSEYWSNRSREIIPSEWDIVNSDYPSTRIANTTHRRFIKWESDHQFVNGERTGNLPTEGNPSSGFSIKEIESVPSNHLKELDDFHDPNRSMKESLSLGWDFGHMKDESELSITSHDTDLILSPSPTLMLRNTVDSNWLWLSSCPFYQSNITSFSSNYNFDERNLVIEPDSFPLTLSNIPNYHKLAKDYNCGISGEEDTSFQPRLNQCSFIGEFLKETYFPKLEAHILPSKFDFDIGNVPNKLLVTPSNWKHHSVLCQALKFPSKEAISSDILIEDNPFETYKGTSCYRETINQFQENAVNVHDCSSFCFQASIGQEKEWPSLLDKSSWDEKEAEIFYGPNEGDYI